MAGILTEEPRSRNGARGRADKTAQRVFWVVNEPDFDAAYALVDAGSGVTWQGCERKEIAHEEVTIGLWRFTVQYGPAANGAGGLSRDQLSFQLGIATRKITQSLQNLYRVLPGETPPSGADLQTDPSFPSEVTQGAVFPSEDEHVGQSVVVTGGPGWTVGTYLITALGGGGGTWVLDRPPALAGATGGVWHLSGKGPDCKGAIGVTLDSVQGAEIEYPVLEFSLASPVPLMSFDKLRTLRGLVRCTNDAEWNGFQRGELLFLGSEPTASAGTLDQNAALAFWMINYKFRYEPNQTDVRVGDVVLPFVGGHEYVWARYGGEVSGLVALANRVLIQKPTAVYVERVFDEIDFDLLEILQ